MENPPPTEPALPVDTPSLQHGRSVIKRYTVGLQGSPGVYRMVNAAGEVLYVGKAKNLRNRVTSYLNVGALNTRLQAMISQTMSMEIITTRSEAEALLLEANLIKKYSPRYNILLKDGKSFPYIFFSADHDYARMGKHRGGKTARGKYFGPFVSAGAVDETITLLQKAFLVRTCNDTFFKNRTRPCMLYQIKRCSAPCVGKISPEDYKDLVKQAWMFLSGKSREIQEALVTQMQEYSLKMHYEKARIVRDRIRALTQVQQQNKLESMTLGDADLIALARDGKECCIQLFSYRGGLNYGNRVWFPSHVDHHSDAEILSNFMAQIYQAQPAPPLVLTSHMLEDVALLEEAFNLHSDYKVDIVYPLRGEKRAVIDEALRNAREALVRHVSINATQREVMEKIRDLFSLSETPQRIEVYDNSHIQGTHAIGAMIVAGPSGFMKTEYRKFDIKDASITPGDDYGMMREVLTRRFMKLRTDPDAELTEKEREKIPDLVLIDGGAGQLSVATQVFEELGIHDIAYVAIAKGPDRNAGREQFFLPNKQPFQLPEGDIALHALQRLRDEAHRFAIGTHRNKRSNAMQTSELDAIPSIGPGRKKALLHHFGSARAVASASMDDLMKVAGVSKSTATIIYNFFHGE